MRKYIVLLLITGIVWAQIDFDKITLEGLAVESKHVTVIGAGLIGVEVAENLKEAGKEVTLIEETSETNIDNFWFRKYASME